MFLKQICVAANGKQHTYWTLVKSIRTARVPRHQVVAYLGELRSAERTGWACAPPAPKRDRRCLP